MSSIPRVVSSVVATAVARDVGDEEITAASVEICDNLESANTSGIRESVKGTYRSCR